MVNAKSVKLLERMSNMEEPESRDSWWSELRLEMRSHARALSCNVILGYSENTAIWYLCNIITTIISILLSFLVFLKLIICKSIELVYFTCYNIFFISVFLLIYYKMMWLDTFLQF
jgi:hypothetical protein